MNHLLSSLGIALAESGRLPDSLIRRGIRGLLARRLDAVSSLEYQKEFLSQLASAELAPVPELANEQHYEVPPRFFQMVLGSHLKYSSCHWSEGTQTLSAAEENALALSAQHAELEDGQKILELGCGWGSLSLWMAKSFPKSRITAVSNSNPQREFITARAAERGLENLQVITEDMNRFDSTQRFDRIVSVEMFEHMRNWPVLLDKVAGWLSPEGRFFLHVFCHRELSYPFVDGGTRDWMARHFFSGGLMPSHDLAVDLASSLHHDRSWTWNGSHYQKTADAWLENLDRHREEVLAIFREAEDPHPRRSFHRWRIFFLACSELFGYCEGEEWMVVHHRFKK